MVHMRTHRFPGTSHSLLTNYVGPG